MQKSDITQDEINLFNELISGKIVEDDNKNFSSIRKSLESQEFSTADILMELDAIKSFHVKQTPIYPPLMSKVNLWEGRRYSDALEAIRSNADKLGLAEADMSEKFRNNEPEITINSLIATTTMRVASQNIKDHNNNTPKTSSDTASKSNDYLNRLFKKYWKAENAKDGDGLYSYPDAFIWKFHYEFDRFSNEEALKFREFLLVPGIKELVNNGLFNCGDLKQCRHLNTVQATQLVEIYNENKGAWKSIGSPKLSDCVFKDKNGYAVVTKEKAREISKNTSLITQFTFDDINESDAGGSVVDTTKNFGQRFNLFQPATTTPMAFPTAQQQENISSDTIDDTIPFKGHHLVMRLRIN